jgi:hypothetical protein
MSAEIKTFLDQHPPCARRHQRTTTSASAHPAELVTQWHQSVHDSEVERRQRQSRATAPSMNHAHTRKQKITSEIAVLRLAVAVQAPAGYDLFRSPKRKVAFLQLVTGVSFL